MENKEKKKYEVVYLPNETYGELPTFNTKEEGYTFIDGLTWNCKISPDKHPCESCNAEFDVFETEQPVISEETLPTGEKEELDNLINTYGLSIAVGDEVARDDSFRRIENYFMLKVSQARKEAFTLDEYKKLYELVRLKWELGYPIEEQKTLLKKIRDLCKVG